ncbi:hypothetical protein ACTJJB_05500 [Chitinophaga sp. 22536]|uniref:hypothetical protein n=1 Tax=unclassified Chitinophaga TaxID=2619133 RepID=UPI003F874D24
MRYGLILAALLSVFFMDVCVSQSINNKTRDTNSIITDPIEVLPFHVYRQNMYVRLPDSLGENNRKGLAMLNLYINRNAVIDSFVIVKLLTSHNGQSVINYYKAQPMNESVRRYYPFISEYLKRKVKIKKVPNVNPDETTIMNLMVRLR